MGWGCYKHAMDAESEAWKKAETDLCEEMLRTSAPLTFGRDGRVCPLCYRDLEEAFSAKDAEIAALAEENRRLSAWLRHIDGGDHPCTDQSTLRQWAYVAVTLHWPAPGEA